MTDVFLYAGEASPNNVKLRDPTKSGGGGASLTATIAVTLDDITAALAATLGHSASESAMLDGVTVASTGTVGHPTTSAITLDDVTSAASAVLGHPATETVTLDDVTFDASATLDHAGASLTATVEVLLDGISFDATATAGLQSTKQGGDDAPWRKEKKRKVKDEYADNVAERKRAITAAYKGLLEPETPDTVAIEAKTVVQSAEPESLDLVKVQKLLAMWQQELDRREEQDDEEALLMLL